MPTQLIECIPNFSEARRPEVIDQIVAAIQSVSEVKLLDRSSDFDHNRTVLTFAGSPAGVEEAAFRAITTASELIDLDQHTGEHPRIGATDVVPFVPLSGATMEECIAIAKRLGERVGKELNIPIYLYEAAATKPERTNLENIRKGQYEGLKTEIEKLERQPDFGPSKLPKAGATVIGARNPLIAFNVYLTTDDVSIAKKIAKAVRQSSGGLRYVKGLGLLVEGRAQVSMNLTNFRETPIARVVEFIRREAERYGVGIHHSELVGLIPQEALVDAAVWYTQLDAFSPEQILESRLFSSPTADPASSSTGNGPSFIEELAAPTPTPGGGSAAAYSGAMGAALVAMVAGVTIGKKKYAEVEAEMQAIRVVAENLRKELTQAVDDDAASFEVLMAKFKMPKDTDEQRAAREAAITQATLNAAHIPLHVSEHAVKVMELALKCAKSGLQSAISDAMSGFAMAKASLTAAGYNVRININSLDDKSIGERMLDELSDLEKEADKLESEIRVVMKERGGI
ncbi:MAG: hypothetical protein RL275_3243 [Chloroflexota bacterium]|jgi:glutamate formiminotransferase / formiminotetrahydrofolate cyclodeaminase